MDNQVVEKINEIQLSDLEAISAMDITDKSRGEAIKNLKTLADINLSYDEACTRAFKEESLVKTEKRKVIVEAAKSVLSFTASAIGTIIVLKAGQQGWFIDKMALGQIPKPKL